MTTAELNKTAYIRGDAKSEMQLQPGQKSLNSFFTKAKKEYTEDNTEHTEDASPQKRQKIDMSVEIVSNSGGSQNLDTTPKKV